MSTGASARPSRWCSDVRGFAIAIACAFLSALTGRKAPADLAMTGELTVVGEVLPIGGVREKVLAAKNFGLKRVILPKANEPELLELKPELVEGLEVFFVAHFDEVFEIVFGGGGRVAAVSKSRSKSTAKSKKTTRKVSKSRPSTKSKSPKKPAPEPRAKAKTKPRPSPMSGL